MGKFDPLFRAWNALIGRTEKAVPMTEWTVPTVAFDWSSAVRGLYHNHNALSKMAVQWSGICADFHSTMCCQVPLRLYRKQSVKGRAKAWPGRKVPRGKRAYLTDGINGPGKSFMYAENAGDFEEIFDSPLLVHMAHPNVYETGVEYMRRLYKLLPVTGNGYELMVLPEDGSNGFVQRLPLLSAWTRVKPGDREVIAGYVYGKSGAREETYLPEEVIHHKDSPALDNHYYGTGRLHNVLSEVHLEAFATQYELATMQNGMRPGDIAIKASKDTTPPQIELMRSELRKRYQGANNAGMPMILVDAEPFPVMRTNKDMEYREGLEAIRKKILAAFGIPESLLQRAEGSIVIGGDKAQAAAFSVYARTTMQPMMRSVCDRWNTELMPILGYEPGELWFAYDDPCPEDKSAAEDRVVKLFVGATRPVISLNEARAELGLEPVDGGDEVMPEEPEPDSKPGDDKPKDKPKGKHWHKDAGPDDPITLPIEGAMERAIKAFFKRVAPFYLAATDTAVPRAPDAMPLEVEPALVETTTATLERAYAAGIKASTVAAPRTAAAAAMLIRDHQTALAVGLDQTTREMIAETLADGAELGETQAQLTARVTQVLGPGTEARSQVIAQTEVSRGFNAARIAAWQESGRVESKEWLESGDPCPICRELSGKVVPIDDEFAPGIKQPPDPHPFCRCSVGAVWRKA